MKHDKEEWVVSLDGEDYNGYITYPTKEAAIEAGRREFTNVKNGQYSEVFGGYIGDDKFFYVALFSRPEPLALQKMKSLKLNLHMKNARSISFVTENCLQNLVKNGVMIQNGRFL